MNGNMESLTQHTQVVYCGNRITVIIMALDMLVITSKIDIQVNNVTKMQVNKYLEQCALVSPSNMILEVQNICHSCNYS